MTETKKYYWLKLKKDFFKRHDIQIIESMENGKEYVLFYLKLLAESVSHNGELRFSETIPYNDKMLATITNTNIDIVRSAIKIFGELELVKMMSNDTIYMEEVQKLLGTETEWAEKKRVYREHHKELKSGQCPKNVLSKSDKSKILELEIDKEKDNKKESDKSLPIYTLELSKFILEKTELPYKQTDIKKGADVIYKLERLDHYKQANIKSSIEWALEDDFWKGVILSGAGLRKKKDRITMKFTNMYKQWENSHKRKGMLTDEQIEKALKRPTALEEIKRNLL